MTRPNERMELRFWRYVNGALDHKEERQVAEWLRTHPEDVATVFALADDRLMLVEYHAEKLPESSTDTAGTRKRRVGRWSGWGRLVSIAACLAIIVGVHLINLRQKGQFVEVLVAHIQETAPNVTVIRGADGQVVVAIVGMKLFPGDRIETKRGETAVFAYPNEETKITVGSGTRESALVIGTMAKGKRLRLEKGMIDASVAPQPADKAFVVTTPHAKAKIVGTVFSLYAARAATWLDVREGSVELTRLVDGKAIMVGAGLLAVVGEKAEALALKTYAKGTAWVDGPILLQDDFEGGMGNWEAALIASEDVTASKEDLVSCVTQMETSHMRALGEEERIRVVRIRGIRLNGRMEKTGIRLRKALDADSYSVEWDRCIKAPGFARSGGPTDTWSRMRNEVVIAKDSNGTETMRQTVWVDGKRFGTKEISEPDAMANARACHMSGLEPLPGSELWLDNIVIRRLVRVAAWRQ